MKLLIVPARSGSKRIKDKNVINFYNKPLLVHSLQIAKKSKIFDYIHLSTDSKKYAKIAEKYGFEVKFLRDKSDIERLFNICKFTVTNGFPLVEGHNCLFFSLVKDAL